jgi:hypothetical protein
MSEAVQREWRFYLDDMIAFAEKAVAYTDGSIRRRSSPVASITMPPCAT